MAGGVPRGIRKRVAADGSTRWQVRYLVRGGTTGASWVETSSTFSSLRQARAFKAERDAEASSGGRRHDPRLGRAPLSRVWDQFALVKQPAVSAKTWSGYVQHWQLRIFPRFGGVPVDTISRADVQDFVDGLEVGPWAKASTLRLLRAVLEEARDDGRIHRNPAIGVSAGRLPVRERHRYLTAAEVSRLARECGDQGDVVTLLAYTGLRWSELVGLRVGDVDLRARRLYVRRSAPEVEGRIVVGTPKTRAGRRMVPLPQVVVQVFARRLAGRESDPEAPAVLSPRGGMLRANNWRRHTKWNTAIKQAGVAPLTIHDLRHTYASLARAAGADLRFVQRTLGHSSPVVTANIYSDLYDSELDTVATNLDRMHENSAFPTGQEPDTNKNP